MATDKRHPEDKSTDGKPSPQGGAHVESTDGELPHALHLSPGSSGGVVSTPPERVVARPRAAPEDLQRLLARRAIAVLQSQAPPTSMEEPGGCHD